MELRRPIGTISSGWQWIAPGRPILHHRRQPGAPLGYDVRERPRRNQGKNTCGRPCVSSAGWHCRSALFSLPSTAPLPRAAMRPAKLARPTRCGCVPNSSPTSRGSRHACMPGAPSSAWSAVGRCRMARGSPTIGPIGGATGIAGTAGIAADHVLTGTCPRRAR